MNPKLKLGITIMTASALMLSTATSFAGTTTSTQVIPESVLELMLAEGLITQAQMDAYLAKTEAANSAISTTSTEATRLAQIKTQLSALVTKGTLTQTQADSVYEAIVSDQSTIMAEREKIAAMTAAELTAYLEANKTATYVSALEALKTAGTITTAQYTAVQKILMTNSTVAGTTKAATTTTNTKTTTATSSSKKTKPVTSIKTATGKTTTVKPAAKTPVAVVESTETTTTFLTTVKTKLAAMVTKGTLTQVQADAAYTAIVADQAALAAEIESIEDMSIEELTIYMASQKTNSRTSTLDALKTSGVLTSSQYNGIKAILTASQGFGTARIQTDFEEEDDDVELPPEPTPQMQQTQRRQGK